MIDINDARVTRVEDAPAGSLVLGITDFESLHGRLGIIAVDPQGGKHLTLFDPVERYSHLDGDTRVLDLGVVEARVALGSLASADTTPPTGALVIADDGAGIYLGSERPGSSGLLVSLPGGEIRRFHRSASNPAFTRYAVGLRQGDAFVKVSRVDVEPQSSALDNIG